MDRTENVELTMLVMLEDSDGRVLMQDRVDSNWSGLCFPGGHVEPGESIVNAAIREMQEETGLTVKGLKLCGIKQFPIQNGRYLVFLFRTKDFTGQLQSSSEGQMHWLRREDFSQFTCSDNLNELLSVFDNDALNEMFWTIENENWKLELL